jgi:phenylacetate-CoA ligase
MNWQNISQLSKKEIEIIQNKKLRSFFKLNYNFHPHYKKLFNEKGINPDSIRTIDDLKKVPFTDKHSLLPTKENSKKYMDFILQPNEELVKKHFPKFKLLYWSLENRMHFKQFLEHEYKPVHMHFTTGRSAMSIPFLYTKKDIGTLQNVGVRLMDVFQVPKDSVAVNAFPYSPHLAFWLAYNALLENSIPTLHTGGGKVMGSEKIIGAIESMKANLVMSIPGYFYHLLREADGKDFSNLKYVMFGGEAVSSGMKQKMKKMLSQLKCNEPKLLSTYAFTEGKGAWGQCCEDSGYHLYPDLEYIELIDPKTGERVEEHGEITYTSLGWNGSTVLRYRTGDICKAIYYDKCSCGRTVPRLDNHIERHSEFKDINLSKIKGNLVNLNQFNLIMHSVHGVEEWQVEIRKKDNDPYELEEVVIYVAAKNQHDVKVALEKEVMRQMEFTPEIVFKDLKELEEMLGLKNELKEKRVVDRRKHNI